MKTEPTEEGDVGTEGCAACGMPLDESSLSLDTSLDGRSLSELATRACGHPASRLKNGRLCGYCVSLLERLHRAEGQWCALRDEMLAALGRPVQRDLRCGPPSPRPFFTVGETESRATQTDPAIEFCGVEDEEEEMHSFPSPERHNDSDDEPLLRSKADVPVDRILNVPIVRSDLFPNQPVVAEEYFCRECKALFRDKGQAAIHLYSNHRIDVAKDPDAIVDSPFGDSKKKRSQKKSKRKHEKSLSGEERVESKKSKSKKSLKGSIISRRALEDENVIDPSRLTRTAIQLQKKLATVNLTIKKVSCNSLLGGELEKPVKNGSTKDQLTVVGQSDPTTVMSELQTAGLQVRSKKDHHKKKDKKTKVMIPCPECPATFNSQARLDYHMVKHAGSKPPYICEICGASYKHKKACDIHVGMHKGVSPWKCGVCEKIFPSKGALSRHEAIHTGTPNYQCDLCGKSFIHTSSFKMHKLSHSGVKPHSCSKCGLALMTRSHLKRHQRVHSGEKRHECDICGKKFSERYNLYAHQKSHDLPDTKNLDCTVCEATFNRRHLLEKHMEAIHQRVIEALPKRRPRNTMNKILQHAPTIEKEIDSQVDIVDVKISLSPPPPSPPAQNVAENVLNTIPGPASNHFYGLPNNEEAPPHEKGVVCCKVERIVQSTSTKSSSPSQNETNQDNGAVHGSHGPLQGLVNYHLANDYPLRMHGVDYVGYLNRQ